MAKYICKALLVAVIVVVAVMLTDAQDTRNNRRERQRGRSRQRGNTNAEVPETRTRRPPRSRRPSYSDESERPTRRPRTARPISGRRRGGRRQPHSSCEEIYLPMCKGQVSYTHTKLPNQFNHTTQLEVYNVLEHKWSHMDHSCSRNTRQMLCSLYLPKCHGPRPGLGPCKRTCMTSRRRCNQLFQQMMGITWSEHYQCRALPNRRCLRPVRERPCQHRYPTCVQNSVLPVCANLTFTYGTLPNMFQQCDTQEINTEVEYYDSLRATQCHQHLDFFLCGVYAPFCIRDERPFSFPCRELCDEIRTACEPHYRRLYHNLPWPNKLQCHRYPNTDTEGYSCVMPNEGNTYMGGR